MKRANKNWDGKFANAKSQRKHFEIEETWSKLCTDEIKERKKNVIANEMKEKERKRELERESCSNR